MKKSKLKRPSSSEDKSTNDPAPDGSKRNRRSLLTDALTGRLLDSLGIDGEMRDSIDPDEHFIHRVVLNGRRINNTDIVTQGLSLRLRPRDPDDAQSSPVSYVGMSSAHVHVEGEDVRVHATVYINSVTKSAPPSGNPSVAAAQSLGIAEFKAWNAKWPQAPRDFDESEVTAPHWEEIELPAYLIPDVAFQTSYDWNKPLEYALASMPEFTVILPMNERGQAFGHDDRYIYSWASPTPSSSEFSPEENEARKATVRFRYRVVGWTKGWREDHEEQFKVEGHA